MTDEEVIGRCLRGELITWDVAIPLSRILAIPPPAALAATPKEGEALGQIDELQELRALLDRLRKP